MSQFLATRARLAPHAHQRAVTALVLVVVLIALRAPSLGAPLGIDEGGMTLIGVDWLRDLFDGTPGTSLYGDHWIDRPPLILGLYGAAQLVGGEVGVRVLGVLCAVAAACLTGTVASRLGSRSAWMPAALVSGALLSSPALDGDRTSGELLAAVPSALAMSLLALVALADHQRRTSGGSAWSARRRGIALLAAGAAAAAAPLVKQSALDASLAATVWIVWRAAFDTRTTRAWQRLAADVGMLAAGAGAMSALVIGSALRAGASIDDLSYALFGFRVDVIAALDTQSRTPLQRFPRLLEPAAASGLLLGVAFVPFALLLARRARAGTAGALLLGGWTLGAAIGVLGGGYYWAHYLLQLAAPVGAATGIVLARVRPRFTVALVVVLATSALVGQVIRSFDVPPDPIVNAGYRPQSQNEVLSVADFLRRNSTTSDRIAVLYARANVAYHADREPATTYLWSSMFRALPQARANLLAALSGPTRAAWVVEWEATDKYGMDDDGAVTERLAAGYRPVAVICGKTVLVRSDRMLPAVLMPTTHCTAAGPQQVFGRQPVLRGFTAGTS